jgi:undecaprenyl-diphosphatase
MYEVLTNLDTSIFLWINGHHSAGMDEIMLFASDKLTWIPFYALLVFFIIKDYGVKTFYVLIFVAFTVFLSDQTSVHLFKDIFMRLRPCHNPSLAAMVRIVNNHCGGSYGFVSSHAANSFAVAGFLKIVLYNRKKRLHTILFLWALLIIYSRVYLGVHYPGDVVAGAVLGYGLGVAAGLVCRRLTGNIEVNALN